MAITEKRLYKLLLLGNSAVGKTALLSRFTEDVYQQSHIATLGVDFRIKILRSKKYPERELKLQLWDTAGQDRFKCITRAYFRTALVVFVVYDITDRKSFEHVQIWLNELEQHAPPKLIKFLIGNKLDIAENRQVTTKEGKELASEYGMIFKETSAKTNINVQEMFNEAVDILENNSELPVLRINPIGTDTVNINALPNTIKQTNCLGCRV